MKIQEKLAAFERLLGIMDDLREKCPWDKKQSMESLRKLTIEETYELAAAIDDGDLSEVKKELGDLALHIVFYAKIASERNAFDISDVLNGICEKLIERHPHIYGELKDTELDAEQVKANWEKLKMKEGRKSVLEGVPKALPATVKANRIQEKVKAVGFDWDNAEQVFDKVKEELFELKAEIDIPNNQLKIEEEFGDLFFSLINYARFLSIDPEMALEKTNKKFINRFQYIEQKTAEMGKDLREMSLDEMETLWQQAKH